MIHPDSSSLSPCHKVPNGDGHTVVSKSWPINLSSLPSLLTRLQARGVKFISSHLNLLLDNLHPSLFRHVIVESDFVCLNNLTSSLWDKAHWILDRFEGTFPTKLCHVRLDLTFCEMVCERHGSQINFEDMLIDMEMESSRFEVGNCEIRWEPSLDVFLLIYKNVVTISYRYLFPIDFWASG